jgi:hypothetical protein
MKAVFAQSAREHRNLGWDALAGFLIGEAVGLIKGSGMQWLYTLSRSDDHPDDLATAIDSSVPAEIVQAQQRIRYNLREMEHAIAHHQFERARFFSAADQKERETA